MTLNNPVDLLRSLRALQLGPSEHDWEDVPFIARKSADEIEALRAERNQLRARVAELEIEVDRYKMPMQAVHDLYADLMGDMRKRHDARATELLEANNREVERRRQAERVGLAIARLDNPTEN